MVATILSGELTGLDFESNKSTYHVIYISWFDFFIKVEYRILKKNPIT